MNSKFALGFGALLLVVAAALVDREPVAVGQDAAKDNPAQNADALRKAKIAYAQALLRVAEADLAKAREADSRIPGTIPSSIIRGLQTDVAIDSARLQNMLGTSRAGDNPYMLAAKESLTFAEESLQQATTANARAPGAVSRGEVDRRQAEVELCRTKLEVAKLLDGAEPLEIARWELLQLQEEVHDLRYRVRLLQYRN